MITRHLRSSCIPQQTELVTDMITRHLRSSCIPQQTELVTDMITRHLRSGCIPQQTELVTDMITRHLRSGCIPQQTELVACTTDTLTRHLRSGCWGPGSGRIPRYNCHKITQRVATSLPSMTHQIFSVSDRLIVAVKLGILGRYSLNVKRNACYLAFVKPVSCMHFLLISRGNLNNAMLSLAFWCLHYTIC